MSFLLHPRHLTLARFFRVSHSAFHSSLRTMSAIAITVCNTDELKDGEMKEVAFGEKGKVLLSKLDGKIHATSAFCTHYGAPLAKGVLSSDGRVVCPWHGACFNVCTGDIEDAPAPAAIHSFTTSVVDGKIVVTADPARTTKDNLSRPPTFLSSGQETPGKSVVIVGGGSGAFHTVESLREHGYKGSITIVSKEPYPPIDRTKLSKSLMTDPSKLTWRTAADLKMKYGVTLRTSTSVTSVDTNAKQVVLENDKERIGYETLVIASGGAPRKLPIPGTDLENVYTFRTVQDSANVDAAAQKGKRLVVIGSSFICMEIVAAVTKRELASIDVIGMEEVPFQSVLGKEVGQGLMKYHQSQGVKFHMQSKVEKIVASEDGRTATAVVVGDKILPADFVVMGVGVAPATEYLKQSGWELGEGGGIPVDELLRVKGKQGIYAIGDVAIYPDHLTGQERRIEHWNVAGNHGRAVGKTIAGDPQPFVKIPVFWSAQGQQLRYCGTGATYDEIIIKGNPDEMKFIAYYVKDNTVVAVSSMQNDPVVSKASELLRLKKMLSSQEIKDGKDLLSIPI